MADTFKILAQGSPAAANLTDTYTVPGATQTIVSVIIIANRSQTPTSFRISLAANGAADTNSQYIAYDTPIGANQIIEIKCGALAANDTIRCYNTLATLSFNILGMQIT
jgi:hypothetical protein